MLINYFIEKAETEDENTHETSTNKIVNKNDKNARVRVNDKTATGGWW